MLIFGALIYAYGLWYMWTQYGYVFSKRDPWGTSGKDRFVYLTGSAITMILWPVMWIKNAIVFHIDQPYLRER